MTDNSQDNTQDVPQARLDGWRAFAEQNRTGLFTLRQLIAKGQSTGSAQLIGGMVESSLIAGLDIEAAGANRPDTLPPRPAPRTHRVDPDADPLSE